MSHSGGTTNLKNHLRLHHRSEYRQLFSDEKEDEGQQRMDRFCTSSAIEKLPSKSARVQELTTVIAEFVTCDLRPVSTIDSKGFLHLMRLQNLDMWFLAAELWTATLIICTYCAVKAQVWQELKQYECIGLTTDVDFQSQRWLHLPHFPLHYSTACKEAS